MPSPWLDIPLEDYEAHMALPAIGQAQMLGDALQGLIGRHAPRSVAILGCAGGNGFDRLRSAGLDRVVGVDVNPEYIEAAHERLQRASPSPYASLSVLEASSHWVSAEWLRLAARRAGFARQYGSCVESVEGKCFIIEALKRLPEIS